MMMILLECSSLNFLGVLSNITLLWGLTLRAPRRMYKKLSHVINILGTVASEPLNVMAKFRFVSPNTGSPSSKYEMYATACVYRELPIVKKSCVNNYIISNKVFLPQMCRELVSCADYIKPFWRRLVGLFETVTPRVLLKEIHSFRRRRNGFKWLH